ncbi:M28 family peptidase [Flagellimonas nanhaiensis]|nr:M28 family peptidase [Allomuricauda nanhaiensis]
MARFIQFMMILAVVAAGDTSVCAQVNERVKNHTEYLASDELEGRGRGSTGAELAATYIAEQFRGMGLKSWKRDSYLQRFDIPGLEKMESNVVGYIGSKYSSDRSIVFTAHYDAYGIRKKEGEIDSIYNGARDNAVGVAALIELARNFTKQKAPRYNLVFVATAAEEFGLYGSKFYLKNPIFPTKEIIICLNIDGFNVSGKRQDYFVLPRQGIDFLDEIQSALKPQGWIYNSPDWEDGLNKSFDTAVFLEKGIPAVTIWTGDRKKDGTQADPIPFGPIHSPEDEITEHWNWEGVEEHLQLYQLLANFFLENPDGIEVTDPTLFSQN